MGQPLLEKDKLQKLISIFKNDINNNRNKYTFIAVISLILISIFSFYFISTNENYYNKTIAKITSITEKEETQTNGVTGSVENIKKQQIKAVIMNGVEKGKEIRLENTTSYSKVYDMDLKVKDEVFINIEKDTNKKIISATIIDFKRDKYIGYITILFVMLILLIGGLKGFRSLTSVIINIIIFSVIIGMFLHGYNLILISAIASILFIVVSILIVSGINKKTVSSIIGTMGGTIVSMLIAFIVIKLTNSRGIHFEEMEFLTHPPKNIFYAEILIGTLGAIMDIAISISSSMMEIYEKNPLIDRKVLVNSGLVIGKDIMGTMANTLVFAYISGSIPIILLLIKNNFPLSYIININMSLEIIRALTGSIGIVISIPITIYTSVILIKTQKIGDF
ncbi:putative membrane protein [Clostridium tetanomorphum]|uniref:YibE/F family protein n=1 Tax=Clostridium tetanomorphum TaxID=1553 RepID=A0A923J0H5_CLOTT|nr:YibE/F family protein [Clostridium tetanomorphum]KAJ52702.1 hypothetical protein CTM_06941 [Clostridium tetanomorphum DSM 665]MBC2396745.1 YibE/F family protein [Clostridium tetanomorphum]MBP1863295.1 putative membrane protein [Clostridium tetanomorphum]NRS84403.1 putative membrane protein [Clostridium tetanomorphum]NRZ97618.1 putative membrane protein [Clostridium tetanomorphum]